MAFDWLRFLETQGVEYRLGPAENIRRNHVGISCPHCPQDNKFHFGIDLDTGRVRGCWRDDDHWLSPAALICSLSHVDFAEAKRILTEGDYYASSTTPEALLAQLKELDKPVEPPAFPSIKMSASFQRFHMKPSRKERRYHQYLEERGYQNPERLGRSYGLRWCPHGEFSGRIIFPIWVDGKLVGWTARAVGRAKPKYKAMPPGDAMQRLLWESRSVRDGDVLVVVEGPFDALRVSYAVDDYAVAVALLTNQAGPQKLDRILKLSKRATRTVVLLDTGAEPQALQLARDLAVVAPELVFPPSGVKDPGDMSVEQIQRTLFQSSL